MRKKISIDPYRPIAGILCLDFINTIGGSREGTITEYLHNYYELIKWAQTMNLISDDSAKELLKDTNINLEDQKNHFIRIITLREALYRIITNKMHGKPPLKDDMNLLNREFQQLVKSRILVNENNRFLWQWSDDNKINDIFWPIIQSAIETLTTDITNRIQVCDSETCGWMFIDQTRNKNRRWCEMSSCGNRSKQRKYQQKLKNLK